MDLDARLARLRHDIGLTAAAAAVMTGGKLAAEAATGERRRGSGIPVTVDDRWHVGSITKSMTATLLVLVPSRSTVLAFATNDGAIRRAENAFSKLAKELVPPAKRE